ncbi:bifunctional [glutamine synthetase] adenylyltransferase/[glutamine synthetase]-adenylyl-L-tyrosine phosphorylase [uncultured Actinomyces sp.]|uniref:bifunctional [glutamine synthetase] adenylyltransferase/[glutamine synthetase]-adenylyl-L-tyrosine phosphorylase n=1 Tax=uncultured Actinomyces sp. TaxID=249061 RepID=UPI00288AE74D|nr:bifunctional [glutamine synthetase] adenylyltransferase/[glutamine synthetase]-adenylyl-L-tyrosine phosphorylase [uncultured Actinomyces sp.]
MVDPAPTPPLGGRRPRSLRSRLLAAGVSDSGRALACLGDGALTRLLPPAPADDPGAGAHALAGALAAAADPDLALLSLVRLARAVDADPADGPRDSPRRLLARLLRRAPDAAARAAPRPDWAPSPVGEDAPDEQLRHLQRLLAVLGSSSALGDFLAAHPEGLAALAPARAPDAPGLPDARTALRAAVTGALGRPDGHDGSLDGDSGADDPDAVARATSALRTAYRERLLGIVADDLTAPDPYQHVETVGRRMSDLADAALDAALLIARRAVGPPARGTALAVIAMGKTGARELNYISDVDVVYVVAPAEGRRVPEEELLAAGTALATELAAVVSSTGAEPPLWPLDTGLRPEGKDGALVRTLASHVAYYQRWAASWEFQALLKARAAAGDEALGRAYEQAVAPFIWSASLRDNFVDDARAMRRRVERASEPRNGQDRRIKLGPGGLRDVEFTVQLLQLVHGRGDQTLRVRPTLTALRALSDGGYVSRGAAGALGDGYRVLRLLEHRSQLHRLRRTHDLPDSDADLRRIGRGIDRTALNDPDTLREAFRAARRQVRSLHEEIYYRPLLGAAAGLTADEMTLTPRAAGERLAAVGYRDPAGAMHHIQALTEGVSRRAAIQRQLLPVIIGWLGEGPDPDSGLLSFRTLSEKIGGSHWYLAMLRDSPVAARRLCHVLSGARWTTDRLAERPESIAWLDDDAELQPRDAAALREEACHILRRRSLHASDAADPEHEAREAMQAVMSLRSRELLRAALADSLDGLDPARTAAILTAATDAALEGALGIATALVIARRDGARALADGPDERGRWAAARADHAIIAMGRLGGAETGFASDADLLFVHRPRGGATGASETAAETAAEAAAAEAEEVARTVVGLLAGARPHPLTADADLRPEGRRGPMSRSLDSYREYYGRWARTWERQALLRARPCAGDEDLARAFTDLIDPLRRPREGLEPQALREIRRLKARMESERLPRGADPALHLKLGPGGLSDVEWVAQILQLSHAGTHPGLRTTSTIGALEAAARDGLIDAEDARRLTAAWQLATRVRAANVIGTGRDGGARIDLLPSDPLEIRVVGRLLGLEPGRERDLEDLYRKTARHARLVAERILFGGAGAAGGSAAAGAATAPSPPSAAAPPTAAALSPSAAAAGTAASPTAPSPVPTAAPQAGPSRAAVRRGSGSSSGGTGPAASDGTSPGRSMPKPASVPTPPSAPGRTPPSAPGQALPTPASPGGRRRRQNRGPYPWS